MAVAVAAPLVVISTSVVVVAPVMAAVVVTVVVHDGAGEFPVRCCDSLRIRSDFVRGHLEFFIANAHNPDAL